VAAGESAPPTVDGTITEIGNFAENTTIGILNFAVQQVEELSVRIILCINCTLR
jgi:hypothetical protein